MDSNVVTFPGAESRVCDQCGAGSVTKRFDDDRFRYGKEDNFVELTAHVAVWTCSACGFSYTDGDAEEARHRAICRHLGVLSPDEIVALRRRHGLTQADLAYLTAFSEASVKRWEGGLLIQNQSSDRLLRVLDQPGVSALLYHLASGERSADRPVPRFRTDLGPEKIAEALRFELRPTGA